jgi:hypothetical protein
MQNVFTAFLVVAAGAFAGATAHTILFALISATLRFREERRRREALGSILSAIASGEAILKEASEKEASSDVVH